jgi:heme exporter protein D
MGEYAMYIWSAYGVAAAIMLVIGMTAFYRLRSAKRILALLSDTNET